MSAKASEQRESGVVAETITLPAPITRSMRPLKPDRRDHDEREQDHEEDDAAHDRCARPPDDAASRRASSGHP